MLLFLLFMNKYHFRTLPTLFFCFLMFTAQSQVIDHTASSSATNRNDSLLLNMKSPHKDAAIIVATNIGVWSYDRFVLQAEYARINFKTVKNNFKSGFVWDNDMFSTNLLMHPYHGGLYFNAARSNGKNFWQSVPFAAGGSLMWELFMENESPSINDFMATSLGGAALGEMTYRVSDLLIDDRLTGFDRFKREALLTVISPVRGLNRIINGDAWKHRNIRGNSVPATPVVFSVSAGHRFIADRLYRRQDYSNMISYDFGLLYGNEFDTGNEKPYDFFTFKLGGNFFSKQPIISRVNVLGMLFLNEVPLKKQNMHLSYGIFQHFNYYESQTDNSHIQLYPYKISEAAAAGPGLLYKVSVKNKITLTGSAYLSAILLGGSQTDHYRFDERDYNMGSGFSSKLNLAFNFKNKLQILLNTEDYRIYSWVGYAPDDFRDGIWNVHGDVGNTSLSVGRLGINYFIRKNIYIASETSYNHRNSLYKYYPDVTHHVAEHKLSFGCMF
ncbi:MAG: hypothetical protein H6Q19_1692 [Bacteroidetes bacterium]|nr:hypothetical protein [Bacteroidota bacterium]